MKRKLAAAISSTVGLAKADVIQIFDVIGWADKPKPTQFSGLLKIDVTTGALLAADVVFPGLPKFTGVVLTQPLYSDVEMLITTEVLVPEDNATLYLATPSASGTLLGYTGGMHGSLCHRRSARWGDAAVRRALRLNSTGPHERPIHLRARDVHAHRNRFDFASLFRGRQRAGIG